MGIDKTEKMCYTVEVIFQDFDLPHKSGRKYIIIESE